MPTQIADPHRASVGAPSGQLTAIEMQSSVPAVINDLKTQDHHVGPPPVAASSDAGVQVTKPIGLFQTSNCINPHPGTARQSKQQIDQCHIQIWFKFNDGCTGYKTAVAQGTGGANCGNSQGLSEDFIWTYCAPKHTP